MYLVHTPDMEEVIEAGATIEGAVASVDLEAIRSTDPVRLYNDHPREPTTRWLRLLLQIIHTVFELLMIWGPFIVVGCISRFQPGQSTVIERVWLLSWLVGGTGPSIFVLLCMMSLDKYADRQCCDISKDLPDCSVLYTGRGRDDHGSGNAERVWCLYTVRQLSKSREPDIGARHNRSQVVGQLTLRCYGRSSSSQV
ncbi:hypothetical protein GE09DRAFT_648839 [Coniochaeta sp. 2T2.1]|nr:hypothetical protein GE09DRAFT_648839 [Coniochaeta sp. 2T2.1]